MSFTKDSSKIVAMSATSSLNNSTGTEFNNITNIIMVCFLVGKHLCDIM